MLHNPLEFAPRFHELVAEETKLTFDDLREAMRRLYDINEHTLLEESNANQGTMGFFNRKSTAARNRKFARKIRKGFRLQSKHKLILAEGDSWFQFPVFVKDVIDWLMKRRDYAICSIASGGDWLINILYEGRYIEELSILVPDVFLISGSGNDLVGSNRLAIMVDRHRGIGRMKAAEDFQKAAFGVADPELTEGRRYITKEFYAFILLMKAQYWIMFAGIRKSDKFKSMRIITQGYANAIPSYACSFSWRYPLKFLVNYFLGTGKWLKHPLMLKGIPDDAGQHRKIVKTMIHELNEMFIELSSAFENVHHIDARPLVTRAGDWFDELHVKSHVFREVARKFEACIDA